MSICVFSVQDVCRLFPTDICGLLHHQIKDAILQSNVVSFIIIMPDL